MRKAGELVQWNDERGFGFIVGEDGERSFVHVSAIKAFAVRPQTGDRVTYLSGTDNNGRPAAVSVVLLGAPPRPSPARRAAVSGRPSGMAALLRLGTAGLILLCALAATQLARAPAWVLLVYLVLGVASIAAYWADKSAAEGGRWRVRESTLHGIDIIGGIAGGLVAQALLRHKTRKLSFAAVTWLVALAHIIVLATLTVGLWDFADIGWLLAILSA